MGFASSDAEAEWKNGWRWSISSSSSSDSEISEPSRHVSAPRRLSTGAKPPPIHPSAGAKPSPLRPSVDKSTMITSPALRPDFSHSDATRSCARRNRGEGESSLLRRQDDFMSCSPGYKPNSVVSDHTAFKHFQTIPDPPRMQMRPEKGRWSLMEQDNPNPGTNGFHAKAGQGETAIKAHLKCPPDRANRRTGNDVPICLHNDATVPNCLQERPAVSGCLQQDCDSCIQEIGCTDCQFSCCGPPGTEIYPGTEIQYPGTEIYASMVPRKDRCGSTQVEDREHDPRFCTQEEVPRFIHREEREASCSSSSPDSGYTDNGSLSKPETGSNPPNPAVGSNLPAVESRLEAPVYQTSRSQGNPEYFANQADPGYHQGYADRRPCSGYMEQTLNLGRIQGSLGPASWSQRTLPHHSLPGYTHPPPLQSRSKGSQAERNPGAKSLNPAVLSETSNPSMVPRTEKGRGLPGTEPELTENLSDSSSEEEIGHIIGRSQLSFCLSISLSPYLYLYQYIYIYLDLSTILGPI